MKHVIATKLNLVFLLFMFKGLTNTTTMRLCGMNGKKVCGGHARWRGNAQMAYY